MNLNEFGVIAEIVSALATVAAFVALAYEIRKSRLSEYRSQILETKKMFQDLFVHRQIAAAMAWKDYSDFKKKYPVTSDPFWSSQIVLEFFDTIGDSVRNGELQKMPMLRLWGTKASFYWWKFEPVIKARNLEDGVESFSDLRWLADEAYKFSPNLKPHVPFQGNIRVKKTR
jgi:hypothetical protein